MTIEPFAWKNRPSLIESILPAQKISAEAQKERKAGAGQSLTALGSYWKGRKPLILVKACVLGTLLPATDDPAADLAIFEKLMAIDDEAFLRRGFRPSCSQIVERLHSLGEMSTLESETLCQIEQISKEKLRRVVKRIPLAMAEWKPDRTRRLVWKEAVCDEVRHCWEMKWVCSFSYLERVAVAKRPEEVDQQDLFEPIWNEVNAYLGTSARTMPELTEQLGVLRFGHRPKVGDTFCGGGSIPFEAARVGCDVYASDLNPVACMLTWGARHIIGASNHEQERMEAAQKAVAQRIDRQIAKLGIEHDAAGNRAKAFLYCLEVRDPSTGWKVPLSPSWVISGTRNVIARLIPDVNEKRFLIEIVSGVSNAEMEKAKQGTICDGWVVHTVNGETYRTKFSEIRGDFKKADKSSGNRLRRWGKNDFLPHPDDILQERLYCIQWNKAEDAHKTRQESFFSSVSEQDLAKEREVADIVRNQLERWQNSGLVSNMQIDLGEKTEEPVRARGWTYWHHLFTPRQILFLAKLLEVSACSAESYLQVAKALDRSSRLCRWFPSIPGRPGVAASGDKIQQVFDNQALNPQMNYGARSVGEMLAYLDRYEGKRFETVGEFDVHNVAASECTSCCDIFVTDPPYADAIRYEEITEYFIAWLRNNPPPPFDEWIWDSRRARAIKGSGEEFRREMIAAYSAMTKSMPDVGRQLVMFTHQDATVWADMAAIVWGAGLQVTAAWYIATETASEWKKGGYVQGTVLLVLRKRVGQESVYRDELAAEVRTEVAKQIDTMVGLNQETEGRGRSENLFEDADLQMAGYAAALRVLTGYRRIDGQDMAAEALRPRQKGERDVAKEMIDYAVTVANEHLVPEGLSAGVWERCTGPERFYLKMLDIEAAGIKKLDNYQNFAKAFRVGDYGNLMGSMKANVARLKSATDFKKATFEGEFGSTPLRALLFALFELQCEVDSDEVMAHLRELVSGYLNRREDLMAYCQYLASKREGNLPEEAGAARVLLTRIKNERLGG